MASFNQGPGKKPVNNGKTYSHNNNSSGNRRSAERGTGTPFRPTGINPVVQRLKERVPTNSTQDNPNPEPAI